MKTRRADPPARRRCPAPARAALLTCAALCIRTFAMAGDATNGTASAESTTAPAIQPLGPGEYNNWIDLSVGGFLVDGDEAQFQRRHGLPAGPFGGVEDFHWERRVGQRGLFTVDGRGIFDNHDYHLRLQLSEEAKGYLQVGYREFRTWYDGSGGYFPLNGQWFSLFDDEMHVDRGEVWFEAGLRRPEIPQLTFRYAHQFRSGEKDSTSWGDSATTGLPGPNNVRGIVPSFWRIDETRDIFMLDAAHGIRSTDLGVGVRYEMVDNENSRNMRRRPGEASDRFLTQTEIFESDLFNAHAFTRTRFNEQVLFTTGYSYTRLDSDVGGSRIYGADYDAMYDPVFARRQQRDEGFLDLDGGSRVDQHVVNLNLMLTPHWSVAIVPSVRVEHHDQTGFADFVETDFGAGPAFPAIQADFMNESDREFTDVSEALEVRYSGLTNWVLYVRGEWLQGDGDLREEQVESDPDEPTVLIVRDTDSDRFTQKYVAGATWYPLRRLSLAGQYYHKIKENDYRHRIDDTLNAPPSGNRYPAYLRAQDFETDDVNVRVTWRPATTITLVSRYDFQLSTVDTRADLLEEVESAEVTAHILSQSISWTPVSRLYLQGSINYVWDETKTPATAATGSANRVVPVSHNDYWNASALVGFALDSRTDLQAHYSYYRADNYNPGVAPFTQPFGAGAEDHGVTATVTRQLSASVRWMLRYGFFTHRDETYGGHNSYDAHLIYSSLQYRF